MLRSRTHDVRAPGRASSASPGRTMSTPELEHALRLFPTLVHIFRLSDYETLNAGLERRIRKVRRKHPLWKGLPSPWQCAPTLHEDDAFKPLLGGIQQCYYQRLPAKPDLNGRITVRAVIGPQGEHMEDPRIQSGSTIEDEELMTCIKALLPALKYPALGEGKTAIAMHPVLFSPG